MIRPRDFPAFSYSTYIVYVNFLEFYFSNVEKPLNLKDFFSACDLTNDGKDAADSPCDEFLEVPLGQ